MPEETPRRLWCLITQATKHTPHVSIGEEPQATVEPSAEMENHGGQVGDQNATGFTFFQQLVLSLNVAGAIGYALVLYAVRSLGSWTPKNNSFYLLLRSAYRINDLLSVHSGAAVSTRQVARRFSSLWGQPPGIELLIVVSIAGLASLLFLLMSPVARREPHSEWARYIYRALLLFSAPVCYLVVTRLTWGWGEKQPLPYPFWLTLPVIVFGIEVISCGVFARVWRGRTVPRWVVGSFSCLHHVFWLFVFWPRILYSGVYSLYGLVLATAITGILGLSDWRRAPLVMRSRPGIRMYVVGGAAIVLGAYVWLPRKGASLAPKDVDSLVIQLSRGPCYGSCPMYTVTMRGDGTVGTSARRTSE